MEQPKNNKNGTMKGCLLHPFLLIPIGAFVLIVGFGIKIMDDDYVGRWMEREVTADKVSSFSTAKCDYSGCFQEAAWEYDFIPWGDLELPDNPNYPGTNTRSYTSSEKTVTREKNTYLVPDGDKIKVETRNEWKEYETPVKKNYQKFNAFYCDDHVDDAQKLIWDTMTWAYYKHVFIAIGVGGLILLVGLVQLVVMKVKFHKNAPNP